MGLLDRDWYHEAVAERDRMLEREKNGENLNHNVLDNKDLNQEPFDIKGFLAGMAGVAFILYFLYMLVKIILRFTVGH